MTIDSLTFVRLDKKYGVMVLDIGPDEDTEKKAVDMLRKNGVTVERTVVEEEAK